MRDGGASSWPFAAPVARMAQKDKQIHTRTSHLLDSSRQEPIALTKTTKSPHYVFFVADIKYLVENICAFFKDVFFWDS